MSRALVLVWAVLGAPAAALPPPLPECVMDMQRGVLVPTYQVEDWDNISVTLDMRSWGNGFVSFSWFGDGDMRMVLQHCPTMDFLLVVAPDQDRYVVEDRFFALLEDGRGYTMRQIREDLGRLGASGRLGRGEWGDCACRSLGVN